MPRQEEAGGGEEENQEEQDQAGQTEDEEDVTLKLEDGKFSQGQAIAVYYNNNFFLGEVLKVMKMTQQRCHSWTKRPTRTFFWWKHEDIDVVHKKFVYVECQTCQPEWMFLVHRRLCKIG